MKKIVFGIIESAFNGEDRLADLIRILITSQTEIVSHLLAFGFLFLVFKLISSKYSSPPESNSLSFSYNPPSEEKPLISPALKAIIILFLVLAICGAVPLPAVSL